ncbi:phage protein Gp27 family protein [Sodalis sp. (in: enterobacteria)]|uniref:phage protein Gp27 family protein n=1 Tax=Sodalis sp. (in: enterobacteria) TaxID=1898979 RepID=UPI003F68967F
MEPAERASLLAKVDKSIAILTPSSVSLKRYQAEVREKIAAQLDALKQGVKNNDGHVSLETVQRVRHQIYGIIK